jgi:putative colanic acid biosynthesis UDP-glucose lipid carrier transferase
MKKDDQEFSILFRTISPLLRKPGITGMAQVKGYRVEQITSGIFHRYQWDAFYIRNARPSLDFKILRITASQTIKSIFSFRTIKLKQLERLNMSETKFLLENLR